MRALRALAAAVVVSSAVLALAGPASATVPTPPHALPTAIEPLATYVAQSSCDPTVKPGTRELASLLTRTYPGTTWGSAYACGTDGSVSEHYEGRAIDWMVSYRVSWQRADATSLVNWLLATDKAGNHFAMARRLGVQYIIWDNRIWGSWDGRWEDYNGCSATPSTSYDNACHRTHVHLSLSWNGAMGQTTFWSGRVSAFDYGPCRPQDLNWADPRYRANPSRCPTYARVQARTGASSVARALVAYSGARLTAGMTGPAVTAVQAALRVPQSGVMDTATRAAVRSFRSRQGIYSGDVVGQLTWRALLRTFA
jgi:peptidoglycan hydrolase-like protein with peptidoglycan-binding domain